ncbi:MAG: ACT domain-containing protein [Clostridia bacterium]|nr:ACT domain-containing protein [Clostridia bacterium]MDD4798787.1 ACT domain-containing protein [Clostridia bacterium]
MRAVITVIGKDTVGILAKVSTLCADNDVNILDVTQSVLQDMFAMVTLVDVAAVDDDFAAFAEQMRALGEKEGLVIHVMHEEIFNSMHRI